MVSDEFVAEQLKSVLSDMHVDVVSWKCCIVSMEVEIAMCHILHVQ